MGQTVEGTGGGVPHGGGGPDGGSRVLISANLHVHVPHVVRRGFSICFHVHRHVTKGTENCESKEMYVNSTLVTSITHRDTYVYIHTHTHTHIQTHSHTHTFGLYGGGTKRSNLPPF